VGIISAHDWIKRHISHRDQSQQIDLALESMLDIELEALYYPRGRPGQAQVPAIVTPMTALPMLGVWAVTVTVEADI